MANTTKPKRNYSITMLREYFLVCPESGEKQRIINIRGTESGLDHLEITTKGATTSWKHKVTTEEV